MKYGRKQKNSEKIVLAAAVVLFVLLCVLTAATLSVVMSSSSVQSTVPFDLGRITADKTAEYADVSDLLLPSFIGITADGARQGVSSSVNTVAELYRMITPTLAAVMADEYCTKADEALWNDLAREENSVYIRYHSELNDYVVSVFADSGNTARNSLNAYIYELFLLPYSESTNAVRAAVRSQSGEVYVYEQSSPEEIITDDDLRRMQRSYRSALTEFEFAGERAFLQSPTEPLFRSEITSRNVIITGGSGALVQNSSKEMEELMRLFSLNPDKLLNRHTESDGSTSYIDRQGILYLRNDVFEYAAVSDGGISLENYIGYTDNIGLMDYVQASMVIFDEMGTINRHLTGGDADITLTSVESGGGSVTLTYEYTFDNLLITGIEPALVCVFEEGMLKSAKLYTLAVRNLGDRMDSIEEWWFADYTEGRTEAGVVYGNIGLVYRSDFVSDSVSAEWCAESFGGR